MAAMDGLPDQIADPLDVGIGGLPTRLRLLCVGSVEPSWVTLTLQLDALGCVEPNFKWVSTANEALALLRDESFDCLLVRINPSRMVEGDDPISLARGIRAGGCSDPIVIVTIAADDETWTEALRLNVDLLVSAKGWESSALVQAIQRAVERGRMFHEIDRLASADRRRLVRERDEADYLLNQQRRFLAALEHFAGPNAVRSSGGDTVEDMGGDTGRHVPLAEALDGRIENLGLPPEFDEYYQELLRTYVIMGSGNLSTEIINLAGVLSQAKFAPREVLDLHLARVERLVRGLGNRSTRHVMARADLLALELMVRLGECYQRRAAAFGSPTEVFPEPGLAPSSLTPSGLSPSSRPVSGLHGLDLNGLDLTGARENLAGVRGEIR
jgi:CheY-like chemotaxis protein